MDIFSNPWAISIGTTIIAGFILKLIYNKYGLGETNPKKEPTEPADVIQADTQPSPTTIIYTDTQSSPTTITQTDTQTSSNSISTNPNFTITPKEINEYLSNLPPLQIDQAKGSYKGAHVKWSVVLAVIFKFRDKFHIITKIPGEGYFSIVCPIDIDKYPQIKILKPNQQFTIDGTIVSVDACSVTLDNCQLFFD